MSSICETASSFTATGAEAAMGAGA